MSKAQAAYVEIRGSRESAEIQGEVGEIDGGVGTVCR